MIIKIDNHDGTEETIYEEKTPAHLVFSFISVIIAIIALVVNLCGK